VSKLFCLPQFWKSSLIAVYPFKGRKKVELFCPPLEKGGKIKNQVLMIFYPGDSSKKVKANF